MINSTSNIPFSFLRLLLVLLVQCVLLPESIAQATYGTLYSTDTVTVSANRAGSGSILPLPRFAPEKYTLAQEAIRLTFDLGDYHPVGDLAFSGTAVVKVKAHGYNRTVTQLGTFTLTISKVKNRDIRIITTARPLAWGTVRPQYEFLEFVLQSLTISNSVKPYAHVQACVTANVKADQSARIIQHVNPVSNSPYRYQYHPYVTFSWNSQTDSSEVSPAQYELQVLKLESNLRYKSQPCTLTNSKQVYVYAPSGQLDWTKASKFRVENGASRKSVLLTEGKGFYTWRVRALGNAASDNYSDESAHSAWFDGTLHYYERCYYDTSLKLVEMSSAVSSQRLPLFYFFDPDSLHNRNLTRVQPGNNRDKDVVQYANGLGQVKQTQTYLWSDKINLTAFLRYDKSGRQVVETAPLPEVVPEGYPGFRRTGVVAEGGGTNRLFNNKDFDEGTTIKTPLPIKTNRTPWAYYGDTSNVASFQGYPYKRTVFEPGPGGRPKEVSGMGKRFTLGANSDGKGNTTRYFYSTASQAELDSLFGSVAPKADQILKEIVIDADSVTTISYKDPSGKVLATNLGFYEGNTLLPPDTGSGSVSVNIIKNKGANGLITAHKKLAYESPTGLSIKYNFRCQSFDVGCFSINVDRKYRLRFRVTKTDAKPYPTDSYNDPLKLGTTKWTKLDARTLVSAETIVDCQTTHAVDLDRLFLADGSYLVEKTLEPIIAPDVSIKEATALVDKQTLPMMNLISKLTDSIGCGYTYEQFLDSLHSIADSVNTVAGASYCRLDGDTSYCKQRLARLDHHFFPDSTETFFTRDHRIIFLPDNTAPTAVLFISGCCTINAPLDISKSNFCVPPRFRDTLVHNADGSFDQVHAGVAGDGKYYVNPYVQRTPSATEMLPDFEGYAYEFYWNCIDPSVIAQHYSDSALTAEGKLTEINYALEYVYHKNTQDLNRIRAIYDKILRPAMKGWEKAGTFNLMVNHMLRDTISCDGIQKQFRKADDGALARAEGKLIVDRFVVHESPSPTASPCGTSSEPCPVKIPILGYAEVADTLRRGCDAYQCADLFKCWQGQLQIWKDQCGTCTSEVPTGASLFGTGGTDSDEDDGAISPEPGSQGKSGRVNASKGIDREQVNGNKQPHDKHADENVKIVIKGFFNKIFFGRRKKRKVMKKISEMVRNAQGGKKQPSSPKLPDGLTQASAEVCSTCVATDCAGPECDNCVECYDNSEPTEDGESSPAPTVRLHLVDGFLNCAGRKFARIITNDSPAEKLPFSVDLDVAYNYTTWPRTAKFDTLAVMTIPGASAQHGVFNTYSGVDRGYRPASNWTTQIVLKDTVDVFPYIKDPVFAYKYFEYSTDLFPEVEIHTCFRDPNMCREVDGSGNYVLNPDGSFKYINCFKDVVTSDTLTQYCEDEKRYVCLSTRKDWSCGQRLSFYMALKQHVSVNSDSVDWTGYRSLRADHFVSNGTFFPNAYPIYVQPNTYVSGQSISYRYMWVPWENPNALDTIIRPYEYVYPGRTASSSTPSPTVPSSLGKSYYTYAKDGFVVGGHRLQTRAELEIQAINEQAERSCRDRYPNIRQRISDFFVEHHFKIGTCVTGCDSVITVEDIDSLANVVVNLCIDRGVVRTFFIDTTQGCRSIYTPYRYPGNFNKKGEAINMPTLYLGVSNAADPSDSSACGCKYQNERYARMWEGYDWPARWDTSSRQNHPPQFIEAFDFGGYLIAGGISLSARRLETTVRGTSIPILRCYSKANFTYREQARNAEVRANMPQIFAASIDSVQVDDISCVSPNPPATCDGCVEGQANTSLKDLAGAEVQSAPTAVGSNPNHVPSNPKPSEYVRFSAIIPGESGVKTQIKSKKTMVKP